MTTNDRLGTRVLLSLALLAAVTIAGQFTGTREAGAVTCPTATTVDTADLDGFPDTCECSGFTLGDGTTTIPANSSTSTESQYMNPNRKDLFVYLQRAAPLADGTPTSLLTETNEALFQPITNLTVPPGLGVTLHVYGTNIFRGDRFVVANSTPNTTTCRAITQKGAWIIEDNQASDCPQGSALGSTNVISTPNALGNASTVYTKRVKCFVDAICAGFTTCIDSTTGYGRNPQNLATSMTDLYNLYQRQNINHELAHQMALVPAPTPTKGKGGTSPTVANSHYPTPTDAAGSEAGGTMVYSVFYKQDAGTITWYIPQKFVQYDVNSKKLK